MTTEATTLAEQLLEAHVAYAVAELADPAAPGLLAGELRDAIGAVQDVRLTDLLDPTALRATARVVLDAVGGSPASAAMVATLVPALHDLPANEQHRLGDVVTWGAVEAIVDVLTRSEQLREEVMRRLAASPAVSTLAMRFVSALLGDAVQQNRERAEKVPGMKSLLGVGDLAARQARGLAPKQLEKVVGGAADRGTQAAMDRVRRALVDAFDEDVVREAVMEVWDLHAEDDIAGLRAYLALEDVEHVAAAGHAVWLDLRGTPWFEAVVDAAVDGFVERHGQQTVAELLDEFGLAGDVVAAEVERHLPRILDALVRDGRVEPIVRRRLEPFYRSDAVLQVLAPTTDCSPPT